eukprot:jgi/Ulvmu1/8476/UM044_0009.1
MQLKPGSGDCAATDQRTSVCVDPHKMLTRNIDSVEARSEQHRVDGSVAACSLIQHLGAWCCASGGHRWTQAARCSCCPSGRRRPLLGCGALSRIHERSYDHQVLRGVSARRRQRAARGRGWLADAEADACWPASS